MKDNKVMLFARAYNEIDIEKQKAFLTNFCKMNGYDIVHEACIVGTWETAAIELYRVCDEHKDIINKVIFTSWDRLSRNTESSIACIKAFRNLGIELECTGKHRRIRRKCLTSNDIA